MNNRRRGGVSGISFNIKKKKKKEQNKNRKKKQKKENIEIFIKKTKPI